MFRLHEDAKGSDTRVLDVFTYDIAASLNFYGEDVPGGTGRVCEGYAALIYGFDMHRNVLREMRSRVRDGYQKPY